MKLGLPFIFAAFLVLFGFEVLPSASHAEDVESKNEAESNLTSRFVTVIVELRAKQGTGNDLVAVFKKVLPLTRESEGIISIELIQNQDDPDALVFIERWETRSHYEQYFAQRKEAGALDTLAEVIEGELSIRYFDQTGA